MRFDVLTIFPGFFSTPLEFGVIKRGIDKGLLDVRTHDLRDFSPDRRRTVDDAPYGGGSGMVMKVEPVVKAIEALAGDGQKVILLTPQGVPFNQALAVELSKVESVLLVCGRYEGVDERIRSFVDMEISVGDYILTGGESAALALVDSIGRLVPGVLGDESSTVEESFSEGLLEYPQYTRPAEWRGMKVPDVLLSGHHREVERYRRNAMVERTAERRPELAAKLRLKVD
ncbi:MAG: tRNA (guanosine(37)-N1)-methyltransferase TrmD [Thermodesulfobacteriota bacterium]|nr:MAG: tRNA (guanosine(37)-N1)-methyltransferase TrmD [Thermodesulfobacteriota bacterium]